MESKSFPVICLVLLHASGCAMCGHTRLEGDSAETVETSPVCGNGILEEGEECEGGVVPCAGPGECGGYRRCTLECGWGECTGVGMQVESGPIVVSGGGRIVVESTDQLILWQGGRFWLFFEGHETVSLSLQYAATVDGTGTQVGGATVYTPPSLIDDDPGSVTGEISVIPDRGAFPFAYIFLSQLASNTRRLLFNFIGEDGLSIMDPGRIIVGEHVQGDTSLARREDGFGAAVGVSYQGVTFLTLDTEGNVVSLESLDATQGPIFHGMVLAGDEGYTVFWLRNLYLAGEGETGQFQLVMQRFDPTGNALSLRNVIIENFVTNVSAFHVERTDAGTAMLFNESDHAAETDPPIADLKLAILDESGTMTTDPVTVGSIYRSDSPDASLIWTGREIGVIYAVPTWRAPVETPEFKTVVKLRRFDASGSPIGDPLEIFPEAKSRVMRIAWSGSGYGVSWFEPGNDWYETQNLHFALVACAPPPQD